MAWQTPKTNWQAADVVSKDDFNRIEGNSEFIEKSDRTPDDTQTAQATGVLKSMLDYFANMIKRITGEASWITAPKTTLASAKSHMDSQANPHSVTYAQVGAAPSSHVGATGTAHGVATTSVNGFMSAEDKGKLAGIEPGANKTIIVNNLTETIPGKALDATQGKVLAEQIRDISVEADTVSLSPETATLYGLTGDDATVDRALKLTTNARFYGKYSQMSGGSGIIGDSGGDSSTVQGFISFANEDNDDFNSINLASSYSRVTIPVGVAKVFFMLKCRVRVSYSSTVTIRLYKNGSEHHIMGVLRRDDSNVGVGSHTEISTTFLSEPVECSAGDYFRIHVHASGVHNKGLYAGSVLRMEVLR